MHKTRARCDGFKRCADARVGAAVIHRNADIEVAGHVTVIAADSDVDVVGALPLVGVVDSLTCSMVR